MDNSCVFTAHKRSCEGYVFTRVCDSVHRGSAIPACLTAGGCLLRGGVETPRKQTAAVANGTHPTGMHSCLGMFSLFLLVRLKSVYSLNDKKKKI